jgi:hypothetical protein
MDFQKLLFLLAFLPICSLAQTSKVLPLGAETTMAQPLDNLLFIAKKGQMITVTDGQGKEYFRGIAQPEIRFTVSGALGKHQISMIDKKGQKAGLQSFEVKAETQVEAGQYYNAMFEMFKKGMDSEVGDIIWNGKKYHYFVPWMLDHCHTMKGLKYFDGRGYEFVDIMRQSQRQDGMIYSFIQYMENADYFITRDKFSGYTQKIGDRYFVRQPTENHPEYIFVNTVYQCWKSGGDDQWLKNTLPAATKALDYIYQDRARFSQRFQLLKRVYTIDSWDFAVEDEYTPNIGLTNSMIIDPDKSKFGIFFGDNTGYIAACYELAEMYEYVGQSELAQKFKERGKIFKERLDKLAWNGRFYTHFIDEDSTVKRNLGVDERSQIAQSNAYSLNRPLNLSQSKAIIETYLNLKNNLPIGSPGEWYAIYPPFKRGFGMHNDIWQYMNGGVGGHVAGELARGAYQNGYEKYGTDILNRLFELGKKYDNKIYFAYTGSMPLPPPKPVFKTLDLEKFANMDFWVREKSEGSINWMQAQRVGDDLRELPVGEQVLAGIPFKIIDPDKNKRKAVLAVGKNNGLPANLEIPINDTTACIYFLHTSSKPISENIVGGISIIYEDGSSKYHYLLMDKHLTYWWFSQLKTDYSGIAWYGKNQVSEGVGLSWYALNNPEPHKKIKKLIFHAPENKGIYTVFGITLANRVHYIPVKGPSYGGPDNWAAATAMSAYIEGLVGVKDAPQTAAYKTVVLSPKWLTTNTASVKATVCYPASKAYLAYDYQYQKSDKKLHLKVANSGEKVNFHLLIPENLPKPQAVLIDGKEILYQISRIENSTYIDFDLLGTSVKQLEIKFE